MQTARGKTEVGKYIGLLQQEAQGRSESQSLSRDMVGNGHILLCVYIPISWRFLHVPLFNRHCNYSSAPHPTQQLTGLKLWCENLPRLFLLP